MNTEEVKKLILKNKNSQEISSELGYSKEEVDLYLVDLNYRNNNKSKLTKEDWKRIIKNRHNNISFSESAKQLGTSNSLISKKLKEWGVVFPNINYFDYTFWTRENIQKLISDFNSGIPVYKLVEKYGFHKNALAKIINKNGGNTTPCTFNSSIFDNIDSEEKAYWLGFLYADGCVSKKGNACELSLQLLDATHLEKFKNFLQSSNSIKLDFKVNRCRFSVCNAHFKENLIKCGCIPQKSLVLTFPSKDIFLRKSLIVPFIRGYFDGDGCFTHAFCDTKKCRFTVSTSFVGTKEFLTQLQLYLQKKNINGRLYTSKQYKNNTFLLEFNKSNSVKLLNLLYSNNPKVYLDRKYEKYLFFSNHKNFAVYVSDYIDNQRAISEKAKQHIKDQYNVDYDIEHANAEIIKNAKVI